MNLQKAAALLSILALGCLGCLTSARADAILWIDDGNNNIGTVDLTTHNVTVVGNANSGDKLFDIAFSSDGTLYGVTSNALYSVSQTTGQATFVAFVGGANALVGAPGGGLYAAGGDTSLISITPAPFSASDLNGSTGAPSAGDLAFDSGSLYLSAIDQGVSELIKLNLSGGTVTNQVIGDFTASGTPVGNIFGLADDGTTMYAVSGTQIYAVNAANADLSPLFDYSGSGLVGANGTAFIDESILPNSAPEPASIVLIGSALIGYGLLRLPRSRRVTV